MMKKDKPSRDEFTLSHGGMRTVASFASVPAMPTNRLRQDLAGQNRDVREKKWRLWMPRRFRVV
jgi:hypothetical protein